MDPMKWISFLPVLISLLTVEDACGSCDLTDPCPPPFPDFMAFFAETLKNIPELLADNRTSLGTDCPESVNWTEFNRNLEAGSPVPLNPVCSHSTTPYPTAVNRSNPSDVSSTSFGFPILTKPSGSIVSTTQGSAGPPAINSGVKDSGDTPNIGLPVGIAIGAAVLLLVVIIVAVCVRRHKVKQAKNKFYARNQSTTSHNVLVTGIDIAPPDTPRVHQTVVILSDSMCQESSTDATIRRPPVRADVIIEKKVSDDEMEAGGIRGCDNKAFEAAEEDLEDPGYAGSEACQENWENEWNNKFEEALMESDDNLPNDAEDTDSKGKTSSNSQKEKLASRTSSNTSKNAPSPTKLTSSPLNSLSGRKSQVLDFRMPPSTRSVAFSSGNSSPTKPPTSRFSRPSLKNWPTSGVEQMVSSSKPSFEESLPSLTPTSDGPPAYTSPAVKPNGAPPFRQTKPSRSLELPTPPMTPSGLPTYTEVMAARDNTQSPSPPKPTSPPKQQRPTPSKQLNPTKAPASNPLKSQSVESSVEGNPNPWKVQARGRGKTNSEPDKPANTAVVRPWTAGKGQASDGRQSAMPSSTPATAGTDAVSATEAAPGDSVGEYSFRPVRSLLSQFETLDRKNP